MREQVEQNSYMAGSLLGRKKQIHYQLADQELQFDLNKEPAGVYQIKLQGLQKVVDFKLIIQK